MNGYINRWTVAMGWIITLAIVAVFFVPSRLSVTTFVLFGLVGLFVAFFGSTLLHGGQAPQSVGAILDELEHGEERRAGSPAPKRTG